MPWCNALAAQAGWKDAVTLTVPGDDGTVVAEHLGLSSLGFGKSDWRALPGTPEAEFAATAVNGVMIRLAAMEPQLGGTLCISGSFGGQVWSPTRAGITHRWARPGITDMESESLWEFQLRAGIIFAFPAAFAAVHWDRLLEISTSGAMAPWSVGGEYDRPIPRRIAEQAGVPRALFGMIKMANSHVKPQHFLARTRSDFITFLKQSGAPPEFAQGKAKVTSNVYLFHWAMDRTMRRYTRAAQ